MDRIQATGIGLAGALAGVALSVAAALAINAAEPGTAERSPLRQFAAETRAALHYESPAREVRLIGLCDGRLMAALEESSFPSDCAWIEPIRFEPEAMAADDYWKELESAAILRRGLVNPMTGESSR